MWIVKLWKWARHAFEVRNFHYDKRPISREMKSFLGKWCKGPRIQLTLKANCSQVSNFIIWYSTFLMQNWCKIFLLEKNHQICGFLTGFNAKWHNPVENTQVLNTKIKQFSKRSKLISKNKSLPHNYKNVILELHLLIWKKTLSRKVSTLISLN